MIDRHSYKNNTSSYEIKARFTCEVGTSPRRVARSAESGNSLSWGEFSPSECWRWGRVMFIRVIISEFFVDMRT